MSGDDEPGEIPATGLDVPRRRTAALALFAGWLLLHVATPLSYYLGDDVYDERFAWRMFSAVRVQQCTVDARETVEGSERRIPMSEILPAPWISLIQRNRPAVIRRFLAFRCASDVHPSEVSITHACRAVTGDALPRVHRSMRCDGATYAETTDE